MKEKYEKKDKNSKENSKLIKAFPKHIAALDKRSVLANVNSKGSGRQKPSPREIPKVREPYDVPKQQFQEEKYSSWQRSLIGSQRLLFEKFQRLLC